MGRCPAATAIWKEQPAGSVNKGGAGRRNAMMTALSVICSTSTSTCDVPTLYLPCASLFRRLPTLRADVKTFSQFTANQTTSGKRANCQECLMAMDQGPFVGLKARRSNDDSSLSPTLARFRVDGLDSPPSNSQSVHTSAYLPSVPATHGLAHTISSCRRRRW